MTDGSMPIPDDAVGRRRRRLRVRKGLYQRFWGGRTSSETPLVVFLTGSPDIGRGYVVNAFERNFETDVYRSNNTSAFADGELRANDVLRGLIAHSRAPAVMFVAGRNANTIGALLEHFSPARAIWFYEDYRRFIPRARRSGDLAAAREHLRQLGETQIGGAFVPGELTGMAAQPDLDADTVWALLWYALHSGLRRQRLERQHEVTLISENSLLAAPRETMGWLFEVIGVAAIAKRLPRRVKAPRRKKRAPVLPEALTQACDELLEWLESHSATSSDRF